ncbi:MAG: hypothetical protein H0U40_08285 [Chloroflexia bacterium]|nr:hypothetical protein [Chloroflexia bacterium]
MTAPRSPHLPAVDPGGDLAFDPRRPDALARRGLDWLALDEGRPGASTVPPGEGAKLLAQFAMQLGASMLEVERAAEVRYPAELTGEQTTIALCCLYVCVHATDTIGPAALSRLGAITDLVADDRHFWWWHGLTLQVALNAAGEGNGGLRALYGNLAHPRGEVRQRLFEVAWVARTRLDIAQATPPLLRAVEMVTAHWPAALAILRGCSADEATFMALVEGYEPRDHPARFRARVGGLTDPDNGLHRYIARPDDLLAAERAIRRRVEARLVGG